MDVETFLVASAIDAVVAQRLARILCERCKEAYQPDEPELSQAGYPGMVVAEISELYRPSGARHAPTPATAAGWGCTR